LGKKMAIPSMGESKEGSPRPAPEQTGREKRCRTGGNIINSGKNGATNWVLGNCSRKNRTACGSKEKKRKEEIVWGVRVKKKIATQIAGNLGQKKKTTTCIGTGKRKKQGWGAGGPWGVHGDNRGKEQKFREKNFATSKIGTSKT